MFLGRESRCRSPPARERGRRSVSSLALLCIGERPSLSFGRAAAAAADGAVLSVATRRRCSRRRWQLSCRRVCSRLLRICRSLFSSALTDPMSVAFVAVEAQRSRKNICGKTCGGVKTETQIRSSSSSSVACAPPPIVLLLLLLLYYSSMCDCKWHAVLH